MQRKEGRAKGPSQRQLSVGEMVRHALAGILQRQEIDDPTLHDALVTVSEVRMSPDLKIATAYVTVLGKSDTEPYVKALNHAARYLRGRLAPSLRQMKTMPELRFRTDESFENSAKIDALLRSPEVARDLDHDDDDGENA
ncbi:ribosome-binding factor A [Consotaella salsifontis]|uniref:Ribosome-binding factor A n=2 Tax=Consotaella salsifontis TaxID=1365950 RepID=A0A1T4RQW8_9HYPH|nr:30S ribosome-binding factor RbfA [Consotaella salsifontis]SKA18216.1 ribosome-binding factor A [Consotaella salsifontis]